LEKSPFSGKIACMHIFSVAAIAIILGLSAYANGQAALLRTSLDAGSKGTPSDAETYLRLAGEVDANLKDQILVHWYPRAHDPSGGFFQNFNEDWSPGRTGSKAIVYESRLTWTAARAMPYFSHQSQALANEARHGLEFLATRMWDQKSGGFFWNVNDEGQPVPDRAGNIGSTKQEYGNGFAIFAAAEVYRATKDPAALDLAKRGFLWYDQHGHDAVNGGYFEILTAEGQRDAVNIPSVGGGLGGKSMNSSIHMLETLTSLYEIWPDPVVKARLEEMFGIVRDRIAMEPGYLNLFFTADWKPMPGEDSYGHDVETAYLLIEAAGALGIPNDPKAWEVGKKLVDHAIAVGWDKKNGGLFNSGDVGGGNYSSEREWWVEAEFLNALLLMHERYGTTTPIYWNTFIAQWDWINTFGIDRAHGGWWPRVHNDGTPAQTAKSDGWTECYHQGRAMMNVGDRLRKLAGNISEK
jgi:mannobiose 2-epimerase